VTPVTFRLLAAVVAVTFTTSCSILAPLFEGRGGDAGEMSIYQSAMADFSTCETAPAGADRVAAAARLSDAAQSMSAITRPTNPDHFYEMDRVVAANARCQEALSAP